MANTNKVSESVDSVNEVEVQESKKKAPRKFKMDDLILCRSVTYGELLLPGKKSKLLYTWSNAGDVTEVEFQDLQALRSTRSEYLNAPMFVIEDEELLEQWSELKALYSKVATIDVDNLFSLPINQFRKKLSNIPNGYKESIKNVASAMIMNGTLDSIQKIKALDEILGTSLMFYVQ